MTSLLEVIKDQAAFGFTGRINILIKKNDQFVGVIYQNEGLLVGASYRETTGKQALIKMIFDDVESIQEFKFVVEPEILALCLQTFSLNFLGLKKDVETYYQEYIKAKKLRPADHLKLVINPEIIVSAESISQTEFETLELMTEWCNVSDIYKHSRLMEHEITNALISLRKKRAIKVFQN